MGQKKSRTVGEAIEVSEGGVVVRPDGVAHTVTGGTFILDAEGVFEVDGSEVEVKP